MAGQLPEALIAVLREMRAAGVSIAGLREATGLSNKTIIKHTSAVKGGMCPCGLPATHAGSCAHRGFSPGQRLIGERSRKWSADADQLLRDEWPAGASLGDLTARVNALLGRDDITPHAVEVRIAQLKVYRPRGFRNEAIAAARRAYWARWRADRTEEVRPR